MTIFYARNAIIRAVFCAVWLAAPGAAGGSEPPDPEPLTLEAAVRMAQAQSPMLASLGARARAMAEVAPQAGSLPDPALSLNALNVPVDSYALDQEPMTQLQVGIQQAFPFPGKLGLSETAARHDSEAAAAEVTEARNQLRRDVARTWWQLVYLDKALAVVATNLELLEQFVDIAQTKYKVGQGLQQDVLLAQLERSKLLDSEIRLRAARETQVTQFNTLLGRSTTLPVLLPQTIDTRLASVKSQAELLALAEQARPQLLLRQQQLEAARARLRLADKGYLPDFKLGLAYSFRQGTDASGADRPDYVSALLSMNLPLSGRQRHAISQQQHELGYRQSALDDARNRVRAEVVTALTDYERARRQTSLLAQGIIPQARQTVASMLAGYQVNKIDFLNLVRTQIALYNYETQYWQALSDAKQALAALASAVGEEKVYE